MATFTEDGSQFEVSGQPVPSIDDRCPTCNQSTQGLPFCPHDGQLVRPFTVSDRYILNELIGAGGTAFVYGGHDNVLGRAIALKMLRPNLSSELHDVHRFLRAARLGSQLNHENIVTVYDGGEDPELGVVYLVMERLIGSTLHELRRQSTRLGWQRTVRILVQVCRALNESHRQEILHRDLSLRNIALTTSSGRNDVVKLCDFGLARSSVGEDRITATGTAMGTPAYMAPEQVRGDAGQDHRVDLYALGAIAYEMLSGRLPHEASNAVAMIASKLTTPATPLSERCPDLELPEGLEALILRCLDADPDARPASAAAIERELLSLGRASQRGEENANPTLPPDADPSLLPGVELVGRRIGHYRVLERRKQGGMGEVYLAEHDVIGTKAALKVLLPEIASQPNAIQRFIQEARASSGIDNPAIPRCYDFGVLPDNRTYVLMEYVEGDSVSTILEKTGPMTVADVKLIAAQAVDALAAAHDLAIIHRDIKPDHIMVNRKPDGLQVKILDFGIAKVFASKVAQTEVGSFMGTPLYCAPEQVLGEPVSPATDIYSLGCTLYEMLSGRPPFSGESGHVLAIKTQRDPVPLAELMPGLPRAVLGTITSMMARDPAERFRSMRAVANAISQWPVDAAATTAALATIALPPRQREELAPARPLNPLLIRGAVVAFAVLLMIVFVAWSFVDDDAPATRRPPVTEPTTPPSAPVAKPAPRPTDPPPPATETKTETKTETVAPPVAAATAPPPSDGSGDQPKKPKSTRKKPPAAGSGSGAGSDVLIIDPFSH